MYSKMELELGLFLLLRIDMMAFKIRSSNVSSVITDFIKFVQVSIDSKWALYKNLYINDYFEVIVI